MQNTREGGSGYDDRGNRVGLLQDTASSHNSLPYDNKAYSLQEAYVKAGGMGRFQYFATVILIMGFISGSFMGQSLQFLTLKPKYECSTDPDFINPPP